MIYGKRVIESHQWLYHKVPFRPFNLIDRGFQWKYTVYLTSVIAGAAFLFLGPAFYFVLQNYHIFVDLADKTEPTLYEHLQRETTWLLGFLFMSGIAIVGLCIFLGLRLTEGIVGPLVSLERHMKKTATGNLSQNEFRIRSEDDFKALAKTYSYLVKSLRAQAVQDLKWLEKISVDPANRDSVEAWYALTRTKEAQLGIRSVRPISAPDAKFASTRGIRRVS